MAYFCLAMGEMHTYVCFWQKARQREENGCHLSSHTQRQNNSPTDLCILVTSVKRRLGFYWLMRYFIGNSCISWGVLSQCVLLSVDGQGRSHSGWKSREPQTRDPSAAHTVVNGFTTQATAEKEPWLYLTVRAGLVVVIHVVNDVILVVRKPLIPVTRRRLTANTNVSGNEFTVKEVAILFCCLQDRENRTPEGDCLSVQPVDKGNPEAITTCGLKVEIFPEVKGSSAKWTGKIGTPHWESLLPQVL